MVPDRARDGPEAVSRFPEAAPRRYPPGARALAVRAGRQRERVDAVAVERLDAAEGGGDAVAAREDDHVLLAVRHVGDRRRVDAGGELRRLPELLAGLAVVRHQLALVPTDEQQAAVR